MAKPDIWMPLYIGDYLADTMHLTTEQHGAYLLLIMAYWKNGGAISSDDGYLSAVSRLQPDQWKKSGAIIKAFFEEENGVMTHHRIELEMSGATKNKSKRSASGSKGAASKWGEGSETAKTTRSERLANARRLATHSDDEWQALKSVCGCCVRCGGDGEIVKDHIKPIYQGGSDGIDNLQPLCRSCNASKGAESEDFRQKDWKELVAKRLANACPSPSPSQIEDQDQKHLSPSATPTKKTERKEAAFKRILEIYQQVTKGIFKGAAEITTERRKNITKCWNRKVNGKLVFQSGQFWSDYFTWCLRDPHWCGETGTWKASLEFVTRTSSVDRIIDEMTLEGVFTDEPA